MRKISKNHVSCVWPFLNDFLSLKTLASRVRVGTQLVQVFLPYDSHIFGEPHVMIFTILRPSTSTSEPSGWNYLKTLRLRRKNLFIKKGHVWASSENKAEHISLHWLVANACSPIIPPSTPFLPTRSDYFSGQNICRRGEFSPNNNKCVCEWKHFYCLPSDCNWNIPLVSRTHSNGSRMKICVKRWQHNSTI